LARFFWFGVIPLSASFTHPQDVLAVQIVAAILVLAMTATTFTTQRQLMSKNMPKDALSGPYAQQQKMLLYVLPLIFAFSGVNFPIGVLIYWTTTNLWSMGQQFYTIRRMPAPGSQAEIAMKARKAKKAKTHGVIEEDAPAVVIEEKPRGQREQPKRKDRNKPRVITDEPAAKQLPPAAEPEGPSIPPPAAPTKPKPKK
jgi:YidC/Oxa1 family membrane protein insertase